MADIVDAIYRTESRRVLATLIRLLGDFDLAEEALHDAFTAAIERWPREGVPENPRAWLVSTGRFKAIDVLRRRARFDRASAALAASLEPVDPAELQDAGGKAEIKTVAGGRLWAWMKGKDLILTDEQGGMAKVTIADVNQSNGVIHVIDTVLMPA